LYGRRFWMLMVPLDDGPTGVMTVPGIKKLELPTYIPRPDETDAPETEMDCGDGLTETEPPPASPVDAETIGVPLDTDAEMALLVTLHVT
jgi:hypothetical protein